MNREPSGFGEQAINKIAKLAIASQLKQATDVAVDIKTDLSKLARGQLDSIAISIYGLLLRQSLKAEEFCLQIGRVTVKPLSAMRGKIKLVHPSEGTFRLVINEEDVTAALNSQGLYDIVRSQYDPVQQNSVQLQNSERALIKCSLQKNTITVTIKSAQNSTQKSAQNDVEISQTVALAITPVIADEKDIILQNPQYVEGHEPSPRFTALLLTFIQELLSLRDFEQKGMFLHIQQLNVDAGKLSLMAAARIEQFPSS